jgi:hypothetical protein
MLADATPLAEAPSSTGSWRCVVARGACAGLLLVASISGGQECPCGKAELSAIVARADLIFVGKPLAATTDATVLGGQPNTAFQTRLMFDVGAVLKGSTPRATAVVTPVGPCGFPFTVGQDYLVVGSRQGDGIVTDACQANVAGLEAIRARAAAIREILRPRAKPSATPLAP